MATCKDSSTTQDEYSLRCSVCLDDFKDPKVLPCCHTFCKFCLKKILNPSAEQPKGQMRSTATVERNENERKPEEISLIFPQCRAQHKILGGVDVLLTDFAIESELCRLKKVDEQKDVELRCGLCESTDPVVSYCADCSSPLCDFCVRAHRRQRQYNGHSVKSIEEVDSKLLHDDTSKLQKHAGGLVCSKHPN